MMRIINSIYTRVSFDLKTKERERFKLKIHFYANKMAFGTTKIKKKNITFKGV